MNPQLFHDLAASEESSGYPENARALRAVPGIVEALHEVTKFLEHGWTDPRLMLELATHARAALAAMDAATEKEIGA
jgi:hypothetical protein